MSNFEYEYSETGDYRDVIVEAEFSNPASPQDLVEIIGVVSNTITSNHAAEAILGGIASLKMNQLQIHITLRFPLDPENAIEGDPKAEEDFARKRLHFILHLFAKIDQKHNIEGSPFKFDFREFRDL